MKSKFSKLLTILLGLFVLLTGCTSESDERKSNSDNLTIVTSFYPIYLSTLNVVKDIEGVNLINLTAAQTGCLHEYQLTPSDLKTLSKADVFVVNGLGMETFLTDVVNQYDEIDILDSSVGIDLIESTHEHDHDHDHDDTTEGEEHDHDHDDATEGEEHDHDHNDATEDKGHDHDHDDCTDDSCGHNHSVNPHVWVSISKNIQQVNNIAVELSKIDPDNAAAYRANADEYIAKLETLKEKMHESIDVLTDKNIITFHEAFPYFAEEFDLNIAGVLELEPNVEPSAKELENIINIVKTQNIKALFIEPQYSPKAAETVARETGAKIYTLDPIVTGEANEAAADDYINKMKENLNALLEALK